MAFQGSTYRGRLTPLMQQEIDQLAEGFNVVFDVEHKDDGTHKDVTADSITVAGAGTFGGDVTADGDGTFTGNVTARSGAASQVDIGEALFASADMNGIRTRKANGDWAIGPTNTNHIGSLAIADLLNTSNTTRQVVTLKATSAYGTPTTYELRPSVATAIRLDVGTYQSHLASAGALRSVNAAEVYAGAIYEAGRTTAAGYWTPYTPTWFTDGTQPDLGTGGTIVGRYERTGNTVRYKVQIVLGTGFSFGTGSMGVTLPETPHTAIAADGASHQAYVIDASAGSRYPLISVLLTISGAPVPALFQWASPLAVITSTAPITFAVSDIIRVQGSFEVA